MGQGQTIILDGNECIPKPKAKNSRSMTETMKQRAPSVERQETTSQDERDEIKRAQKQPLKKDHVVDRNLSVQSRPVVLTETSTGSQQREKDTTIVHVLDNVPVNLIVEKEEGKQLATQGGEKEKEGKHPVNAVMDPKIQKDVGAPKRECGEFGEWAANDVQEAKYMTFSLKTIPDCWHDMLQTLRKTDCGHKNFRIINAANVTLMALKELYYLQHPGWEKVRDHVHVGMYKETANCGNTSVSMGLATSFFLRNPNKVVVAFLNCGSGGMRVQIYSKFNDVISVLFEFKPKEGNGPAVMSSLVILNSKKQVVYKPRSVESKTESTVQEEIQILLEAAPWASSEFIKRMAVRVGQPEENVNQVVANLDVFAFVTGSIREAYLKAGVADKIHFDDAMARVFSHTAKAKPFFRIFHATSGCYFLDQELEGFFPFSFFLDEGWGKSTGCI